jgi:hypothetical protein
MARPAEERDPALLLDMVLAARSALSFVEGMDEAAFMASALHQNAVIRSLEVLGEAARNVSPATRASLIDVAWSEIIGVRGGGDPANSSPTRRPTEDCWSRWHPRVGPMARGAVRVDVR